MPRRRRDYDEYDDYDPSLEPHRGVLILILGALSVVSLPILGPVAWVMGSGDLRKMDAGEMDPAGRQETYTGYICGIVGTVFLGVFLLILIAWFAIIGLFIGIAAANG